MKKKVFVGLSGGVDSTVAALLLKKEGYEVTGVYLKNWSGESLGIDDNCPWEEDLEYVERVSAQLDIPYITYNFEEEYRKLVIEDFYKNYALGNTPNPDILCNSLIKFDAFLNKAIDEGADFIATGHYAITRKGKLFRSKDSSKDQTYFLAGLSTDQLSRSLFPIGHLTKKEVRKIALDENLVNANRKDSQGICFVGKVDIQKFLSLKLKPKQGDIVDIESNRKVGEHQGVWFYTNGQRKGLEIGGLKMPYFVCKKDVQNNTLFVANGRDNPHLWQHEIVVSKPHLIDPSTDLSKTNPLAAMIRYRSERVAITIQQDSEDTHIKFAQPQWAPAPGQSVVFYSDDECLGLAEIL